MAAPHLLMARAVLLLSVSVLVPGTVADKGPVWASYPDPSITVAATGKGDFTSVQQAVDAAMKLGKSRVVISVQPGIYNEKVIIPSAKGVSIALLGTSAEDTIIQWHDTAGQKTTFWSCSVCIAADNFVASKLSFMNNSPWPGLEDNSTQNTRMAVALRISGTNAAFYGCHFLGWQDTLYDHKGLHFFRGCYIEGIVDFVFGNGQSVYEGCIFKVKATNLGGSFLAQKRMTTDMPTGFVALRSAFTGTGRVFLGRAWGPASRAVLAYSWLNDVVVSPAWNDWGIASRQKTAYFAQYNCFGPGSSVSLWNPWTMKLNAPAAQPFLSYGFIDAPSWLGAPPPGVQFGSALPTSFIQSVPPAPEFPGFQDKSLARAGLASLRAADSPVAGAAPLVVYGKAAHSHTEASRFDIFPEVMDASKELAEEP